MTPTSIQAKVAETAWRVWPLVFNDGPQTLVELKKKLVCPANTTLLDFALGWLAWENKIEIRYEKNSYRIELARRPVARTWVVGRPLSAARNASAKRPSTG